MALVSDSNRKSLRKVLATEYEGLVRRLTRRVGSADFAREALHETFLRVERVSDAVEVHSPLDYLFRMALNAATDRSRSDRHLLSAVEIDAIMELADQEPNPCAVAESRMEMEDFEKAINALPPRQRDVFIAAHLDHLPHREIAARLGINVRTVDFDLQHAMEHLARRLGRTAIRRSARPSKLPSASSRRRHGAEDAQ